MSVSNIDPVLRLVMTVKIDCTPFETVGQMGKGVRRIMQLTGGTFEILAQTGGTFSTPAVRGVVLGGYDWQILHSDSLAELDVRYNLRTERGDLIYVQPRDGAMPGLKSCKSSCAESLLSAGRTITGRRPP
jgi:hypothetical protein